MARFRIGDGLVALGDVLDFAFERRRFDGIDVTVDRRSAVDASHALLQELLEKKVVIYGVTTGFGDNCSHPVDASQSEQLRRNLISYLLCGTGAPLPRPAVRAMCVARLVSLTRGHSGVSWELVEQLREMIAHDIMPIVPCEGSLGASGDLVPLAYLAEIVQGQGRASTPEGEMPAAAALKAARLAPYALKPKEGLALVNGTSTMAGMGLYNYARARYVVDLAQASTAWLTMVLRGRAEAFGPLVNEKAKRHDGQRAVAARLRQLLAAESYETAPPVTLRADGRTFEHPVQDRYSLRCAPQILGPVHDTLATVADWLEREIGSASDNPLLDPDERTMATGGNFYGGYLGHSMDYLKICVAHAADMLDRQLMLAFDPKTAAGLPPNLAHWAGMAPEERHIHHGLKGLHQVCNAITAEIMAMSGPTTVHSRSSESHNQDKVSLGMSAAMALSGMLDKAYNVCALSLACMAQALDLRGIELVGAESKSLYELVRRHVPFVERDTPLGGRIGELARALGEQALRRGVL